MVFDPDLTEIAVEGFNAVLETDVGDKCLHFAANPGHWKSRSNSTKSPGSTGTGTGTSRSDRRSASNSSASRRDGSERSEDERRRRSHRDHRRSYEQSNDESDWSRKSYWQSKVHQQRQQHGYDEPRARRSQNSSDEWSKQSYLQSRRHQQPSEVEPRQTTEGYENQTTNNTSSETAKAVDQRHDSFRLAKSAYMPPPPSAPQTVPRMMWNEEKLYGDVGRAVQEAMRKSAESSRARSR